MNYFYMFLVAAAACIVIWLWGFFVKFICEKLTEAVYATKKFWTFVIFALICLVGGKMLAEFSAMAIIYYANTLIGPHSYLANTLLSGGFYLVYWYPIVDISITAFEDKKAAEHNRIKGKMFASVGMVFVLWNLLFAYAGFNLWKNYQIGKAVIQVEKTIENNRTDLEKFLESKGMMAFTTHVASLLEQKDMSVEERAQLLADSIPESASDLAGAMWEYKGYNQEPDVLHLYYFHLIEQVDNEYLGDSDTDINLHTVELIFEQWKQIQPENKFLREVLID